MLPIGLSFLIKCYEVFLSKDQINIENDIEEMTIYYSNRMEVDIFLIQHDNIMSSNTIISNFRYGILNLEQAKQLYADYQSMDDNQLVLSYGRDPFEIKKKIPYIDIIQKLLEEN